MKTLFLFFFLCLSFKAHAQLTPLGLLEGLMANSGVATQKSTAASYYNPSLLDQRTEGAFNLGGNSVGARKSEASQTTVSSALQISPTYLSVIQVNDSVVQELFMANVLEGQFDFILNSNETKFSGRTSVNQVVSGYSLAFRNFPMALQVLGRYTETSTISFTEGPVAGSTNPDAYLYSQSTSEFRNLNLALGLSTNLRFDGYTLGFNLTSRGINLLNKDEGQTRNFTYGDPNTGDLEIENSPEGASFRSTHQEGKFAVGHGFKLGDHEFLTDTLFYEESGDLDRYKMIQTFGYRMGTDNGHQLLCGLSHQIGPQVEYFGQSLSTTVGYSWTTRKLRSSVGLYFTKNDIEGKTQTYGLVFGSQYEY